MTTRKLIPLILLVLLVALFVGVPSAAADSSHARIIRLSLVQGDVRFARETHGDPLADSKAVWETAQLNLPIEQGYVLATDNGRAEVEFENGAMAFLKENTVLQFYDLSLKDGMFTTRLVVLQGSASFYVNPARGDYFSVTGGDFTVEASGRATFRLDNYDNGSTVEDMSGRLSVLHNDETTRLNKGQSLSMKAGDEKSINVGRLGEEDEFDRWVSGQIDSVSSANAATLQYTGASYYAPGFASLYSYGSWFDCGGYGYGWRPFGAGYGWSPFMNGQWVMDPAFGWTWVSFQPWGWAPYHYGGWLFDAGCGGWFYSPPMYYGGYYPGGPIRRPPVKRVNPPRPIYRPVTAVFVRNNGKTGIVPMHPLDEKGKAPLNLEHGVFNPLASKAGNDQFIAPAPGQKWDTLKSAPKDAFPNRLAPTAPPVRVSKTVLEGASGARTVTTSKDSSIVYDPKEHRFVNSNNGSASGALGEKEIRSERDKSTPPAANGNVRTPPAGTASSARNSTPPRVTVPPPAPRYSGGERGSSSGSGSTWSGGSRSSGSSGAGSSGRSSPAPAPAPAPRSSGGGKPH
ncbi:MAG TPA: DUF6600 domain-containing protein [Candidatus Angelobacter sp.]|nr:DUF6600 domain-containing protein [Candidatus Angelobacter sp.]